MEFSFGKLNFCVNDGKIYISSLGGLENTVGERFLQLHIAGKNKNSHMGSNRLNKYKWSLYKLRKA